MKFSNGCWLQKEGCECFTPQSIYATQIDQDKVTMCAPTQAIRHRGDTLGGINLTLMVTAPIKEVIRVQVYHHKGVVDKGPKFEIDIEESVHLDVEELG